MCPPAIAEQLALIKVDNIPLKRERLVFLGSRCRDLSFLTKRKNVIAHGVFTAVVLVKRSIVDIVDDVVLVHDVGTAFIRIEFPQPPLRCHADRLSDIQQVAATLAPALDCGLRYIHKQQAFSNESFFPTFTHNSKLCFSAMTAVRPVFSLDDHAMDELCEQLATSAHRWKSVDDWPAESLSACANAGVIRWFMPAEWGGLGWNEVEQTIGYLRLSEADLTTTFVITQLMGAVRRIAGSENQQPADRWLKRLISGEAFATVGISHLTTSRQHLVKPILRAERTEDGFYLEGMAPWVTGVPHADVFVVGATMDDGKQILAAVPRSLAGVHPHRGAELMALTASCTDRLEFDRAEIDESMLIAGPAENVMKSGAGGSSGGLQTSTLAVGLSRAAIGYLGGEAEQRKDLEQAAAELQSTLRSLEAELLRAVGGDVNCDVADIRGRANRLVLNSTQAALMAAKGAGYMAGHPVNRWCREALFFLVWSCPRPIADAHLCELAGIT